MSLLEQFSDKPFRPFAGIKGSIARRSMTEQTLIKEAAAREGLEPDAYVRQVVLANAKRGILTSKQSEAPEGPGLRLRSIYETLKRQGTPVTRSALRRGARVDFKQVDRWVAANAIQLETPETQGRPNSTHSRLDYAYKALLEQGAQVSISSLSRISAATTQQIRNWLEVRPEVKLKAAKGAQRP